MTSSGVSKVLQTIAITKNQEIGNVTQTAPDFGILLNSNVTAGTYSDTASEMFLTQKDTVDKLQQSYEKEVSEAAYKDMSKITEAQNVTVDNIRLEKRYEELKETVTEMLTEKMNVTEEELLQAMETLGISFMDLLQGNGLAEVMLQLTGGEDMADLLFNDTFRELMLGMEQLFSEFAQQNGLTAEELTALLSQMDNKPGDAAEIERGTHNEPEQLVQGVTGQDETKQHTIAEQQSHVVQQEIAEGESSEDMEGAQTSEISDDMDALWSQEGQTAEKTQATKLEDLLQNSLQQQNQANSEQGFGEEMEPSQMMDEAENSMQNEVPSNHVTYQNVQTTVNALGSEVVQVVEQTFVDVADIMNQITEFTRVTVEQTQSSIEMQLNPEHLGKIYLQVASKEGVITAQLAAQNEAVKQALENQVALLKENLNQQGMKVEAVEVTIATHEFEQNLENNRQQTEDEQGQQNTPKNRRFLTVDQLDDLAGILSEEESLAARIMLENGNSMDVTA